MKIFLSWSGDRSRMAASALREWLPLVLYYAEPWLSDLDIAAGERWAVEIGRELEGSQFGIIALTSENLSAPWILFEAGALSKAFSAGNVCPYLIDVEIKDLSGPLSQFQAKKSDQASTFELVEAINTKAPNPIESSRLAKLFDAFWKQLQIHLESIPAPKGAEPQVRSEGQVLEELVVATRRMEARLERLTALGGPTLPTAELTRMMGLIVRRLRTARRWSIRELASRSGISERTVLSIEAGTQVPSVHILKELGRSFEINLLSYVDVARAIGGLEDSSEAVPGTE